MHIASSCLQSCHAKICTSPTSKGRSGVGDEEKVYFLLWGCVWCGAKYQTLPAQSKRRVSHASLAQNLLKNGVFPAGHPWIRGSPAPQASPFELQHPLYLVAHHCHNNLAPLVCSCTHCLHLQTSTFVICFALHPNSEGTQEKQLGNQFLLLWRIIHVNSLQELSYTITAVFPLLERDFGHGPGATGEGERLQTAREWV